MHKRPSLSEALTLLRVNNQYDVLDEYLQLQDSHGEFFAARFVVDIADHYNHLMEVAVNG
jgi:hypothetical protein